MAGYSGTPLPKKLGLKPGYRVAFIGPPPEVKTELHKELSLCKMIKDGRLDFAMIFTKDKADLKKRLSRFTKQLAPAGMLWVSELAQKELGSTHRSRRKCHTCNWVECRPGGHQGVCGYNCVVRPEICSSRERSAKGQELVLLADLNSADTTGKLLVELV
jgi:hypothetical protein